MPTLLTEKKVYIATMLPKLLISIIMIITTIMILSILIIRVGSRAVGFGGGVD